jgi:hypothetical protein
MLNLNRLENQVSFLEILYMTNKMELMMTLIINNALHVSGVYHPSSGAHELYVQLMVTAS